ncbi:MULTISPECIES: PH domain-containing protein [unclassified Streptomyces]|uniref:PH domain-containing protein n=1 Tax=unclassified Streptomyces TaxID=2593676 RepID=UPI001CBE71A7|nr:MULTISPECIES: PH domain-containing protein [unclassified Streptomyces]WPO70991.1 PH domain-containing protein [Streptomyces sp. KN37]
MPLPFLTADRAFDDAALDAALPFDDRDQWRRPYRPGPWRVGVAALSLLLASYILFAAVIIAFADRLAGAAICAGLALLIVAGALRLLRVGTWVSARGVRRVGFLRTRTVPWAQVEAVRTAQQPVRWLGLPRTVQGQALILVRRGAAGDGQQLLLTDRNADFLARHEAFNRAADSIEVWADEYRATA